MALPRSTVFALPPMSGVRGAPLFGSSTVSIAVTMASPALAWPRCSSIIAAAEIRQDVAEQVGCHHDVEPVRMLDEVSREDVDVELVPADVGILPGHRLHALVPVRHGDRDAVRLRRRRQVLLRALAGQLERE